MQYVLGISGLGQSQPYMRRTFPGMEERMYRLAQGADSAAALVTPAGIVAAAAEERFVRRKATGEFPAAAIAFVLRTAGITPSEVSAVAHNFDFGPYKRFFESADTLDEYEEIYAPEVLQRQLFEAFPRDTWSDELRVVPVAHHRAHAASAFYCSGYREADILVADGIGEFESTTLYAADSTGIAMREQVRGLHSIGLVYGLVTAHLGFWMNMDEYKVMGLAPYGNRASLQPALERIVERHRDGSYATPLTYLNQTPRARATYENSLAYLTSVLGPAREPGSPLKQHHFDIAAALQAVAEDTIVGFLTAHHDDRSHKSLCLAGGVALNCVINQAIRKSGLYQRQFVQPAAGDDGTALGAALAVLADATREDLSPVRWPRMGPPYYGPDFSAEEVSVTLDRNGLSCRRYGRDELVSATVELLADGKVVALYQGRMEYGPRALGNRSILADPRTVEMRDRINSIVKQREEFRPLAPAVLQEYTTTCFHVDDPDDFLWMIETVDVRDDWRSRLGAVTHVDGTARIQVVRRVDNELYWRLIDGFRERTGIPVLLNTSFNSRGEPIVCSPEDAVTTFLRIDVDAMVMGDYMVWR